MELLRALNGELLGSLNGELLRGKICFYHHKTLKKFFFYNTTARIEVYYFLQHFNLQFVVE